MSIADRWLLPDGVEEVLPPSAAHLEAVRRRLLDLFERWGYELVITPMVEYLESLLTGTGKDLDLKTFKVTDQVSGRMMGIRADITPQVARIDAHSLHREGASRLCYAGTVLHAKADNMLASRTPIAVGAELFGDTGNHGDLEIVSLMIEAIRAEGITPVHLELGDVGIFRELVKVAGMPAGTEEKLFELIQRKAVPELGDLLATLSLAPAMKSKVMALPGLCGDEGVIDEARRLFESDAAILARIDALADIARRLAARFGELDIYYDLSELRGYAYHTGIVFACYVPGTAQRLAKGGRYDHVGEVFGRARAATGFDIDLKVLARSSKVAPEPAQRVRIPGGLLDREGLWAYVAELRRQGFVVVETDGDGNYDFSVEADGEGYKLAGSGS
ncbi:MAG: ATP phosphoribosyltransferase regulatory subunit [Pseudomonadales bacterium]|nr:ATP phosphoribosyltransferase regulatory subunit [Pseudomonadales bacterium]